MADNPNSKNEQFLQKLERQRLHKECNRVIDLRGRVTGECQAYTFGGKTHYLDDRAYLLAKQLLARFNGKYTTGVYESVLKVVKKLNEQQLEQVKAPEKEGRSILLNDEAQPQLISFDQLVRRQEDRIVFATPIKLTVADMLYHGSTIDITTSAIRITLKRTYTLEQGEEVSISFPDFHSADNPELLSNIPYKISHIKHGETHTQAILVRHHNDDLIISKWLDEWTQKHNTTANHDLDSKMVNLVSRYYLRLYTHSLNSALIWLSDPSDSNPIKAFHLMPRGEVTLSSLLDKDKHLNFSLLPLKSIMAAEGDIVVVIAKVGARTTSIAVPRSDLQLIAKALNWSQQHNGTVLLLHKQHHQIEPTHFTEQLNAISVRDKEYGADLTERLSHISACVTISDLSTSTFNTESVASFTDDELKLATVNETSILPVPPATPLAHYFTHHEPRFYIRTTITVHINGEKFQLTSLDASAAGLSFTPPNSLELRKGMHVFVDFNRWQDKTTKVKLMQVPYIVKNISHLFGLSSVGMERNTLRCPKEVNTFFNETIEKNKGALAQNNLDIITPNESHIFSSLFSQSLPTIPLYFGMSDNNKRIVQAIASTRNNHAEEKTALWRSLTRITALLSETLKTLDVTDSANFGLYCYQSSGNYKDWVISTDLELKSAAEKAVFINRALAHKNHIFFQCSIMPLALNALNQEQDLTEQLAELRHHSPHKVKKIKEILQNLFSVGELKDISDIIKSAY